MSEPTQPSHGSKLWGSIFVCFLIWACYLFFCPNFVGGGPSKINRIFNNLRILQGAQGQWALEHHMTGSEVVTQEAIASYCGRDGWIKPVAGELYILKTLREIPEAQLTRDLEGRPKGTVFRLGTNGEETIILPDKPR